MERTPRILFVDDDADIVNAIKLGLERQGFRVEAFVRSRDALSSFEPDKFDLALLDIDMPELDGFQLAHKLIEIDGRLIVCFLTAFSGRFEEPFSLEFPKLSTDCFLRKPMTIAELSTAIHKLLKM